MKSSFVNKIKSGIALIIIIMLSYETVSGQATTIYIDPQYTGVKNGTIAQPYNSWSDLTWKAGYTYLFKRGSTYSTSSALRATASNITIGAYGTGNRPIITSSISGGKIFDFGSLSNIVVSDLEVISTNNAQSCFHFITGGRASLINCKMHGSVWGVRNIQSTGLFRIINCEIYMTGDDGSYNEKLDSIEVSGTYIHDVNQKWFINQSETYSGGDALQLNNVKYFNIHNNTLDHSGTGNKFCFISENSGTGPISTGVILNNTFKRSDNGNCIYLYQDQQNVLVKGNKFINAGIGIYNHSLNLHVYYNEFINISDLTFQGLGPAGSDTRIINNTFYNVNNLISCYNETLTFQNNIIYKCYGKTFTGSSNIKPDYNCYYLNNNLGISNTGTNSIYVDPLLNDPANLDLKLKNGSPCINKACNILGTTTDLMGFNVPYNNAADIGALEYGTANTSSNTPLVTSIISPANNSTFIAPAAITITASASVNGGTISKVEFYNGSTKLGETSTAPYTFSWSNVVAGTYTLTTIATDNSNAKTTSSAITIVVNNKVVTSGAIFYKDGNYAGTSIVLAPGNYTTSQILALGLADNTISSIALNGYQITAYVNDNFSGTSMSFTTDQPNLGTVGFNDQISSIKVISVSNASNLKPAVSITSPSNGQNYSSPATITITANSSDTDGTISKVEFYNGSVKIGERTSAPYSITWANVTYGSYILTAVATDNLNAKTTSTVKTIYVN